MAHIFISYSRKNSDFVRKLNNDLQRSGRDTWVDWEDIPRGEPWLNQIYQGIEQAHTLLCIISRHSLMSEICNEEFTYAFKHNKRVLPLILEQVSGDVFKEVEEKWLQEGWGPKARDNWDSIGALNWLFYTDPAQYDKEFNLLLQVLDTDQQYVETHTRYQVLALEWDRQGMAPSLALFGDEIDRAEAWLDSAQDKNPQPSPLHHQYIQISREKETERQERAAAQEKRTRRFRQASFLLLFMAIVAGIATAVSFTTAQQANQLRRDTEYDATVFALEKVQAEALLLRFGRVLTPDGILSDENIIATATAFSNPTAFPMQVKDESDSEMVLVPAGCFLMGSFTDGAIPVHQYCFEDPFWLDRYEVSRADYVGCSDCEKVDTNGFSQRDTQPISGVSWWDALTYCSSRGARLPTEAEWEYAARGPSSLAYPWGDTFVEEYAVYIANANNETQDIGERPLESASWVGAFDLSGNVAEWVSTAHAIVDADDPTVYKSFFDYPYVRDERESINRNDVTRVVRGGSSNNEEAIIRPANRQWLHPEIRNELIGFRCAKSDSDDTSQAAG